jgi:hypothetical protein
MSIPDARSRIIGGVERLLRQTVHVPQGGMYQYSGFSFTLSDGYSLAGYSQAFGPTFHQCSLSLSCTFSTQYGTLGFNYIDGGAQFKDVGFLDITSPALTFPVNFTSGTQSFTFAFTASGLLSNNPSFMNPQPACDLPTPDTGGPGPGLCTENITASGVETITIEVLPSGGIFPGPLYNVDDVRFVFAATTAPEPSSAAMFALAGVACLLYRRRQRSH